MTSESTSNRVELLAPAGGPDCLQAAVCAGADAVYLGLDRFNARRNAQNFTVESLAGACDYAHLRGVNVYVTMNIEILPSELESALGTVRDAYAAGADAFIVQDIGLARLMRDRLPDARMHASTQMNIHSAAGIEAAWRLGARRVTLARELSLAEIGYLVGVAADFGMEVETFAHGALCVCYSGQCLMSSLIGGRSANRGLCAQACRLPYELHANGDDAALPSPGEHLLSPRDLCTAPLLADLVRTGVASLKIEGRMKSPDYVHTVVGVYRAVLDRILEDAPAPAAAEAGADGAFATPEEVSRLEEAFSRGFTTAYLENNRGNGMMSYGRPNNRGVFVGRVARADEGAAEVAPETALNAGDVLEIWTNRGHFSASVGDPVPDGKGRVRIATEQRASKGDRVFRVRNAALAFEPEPEQPRVPVAGRIELHLGRPARLTLETSQRVSVEGPIVEPARTKPLAADDVCAHIDRFGQTPFDLVKLDVELDEGAGMGFSQLHHLRAEAAEQLRAAILAPWSRGAAALADAQKTPCAARASRHAGGPSACRVVAWAANPACARAAKRAGADDVYVPVLNCRRGQAVLEGCRQDDPEQAGYPKQCIRALPTVDHDPLYAEDGSPETREAALAFDPWDYVAEGKRVYVDSVASIVRSSAMGAQPEAGIHVPVTNAASLSEVAALGATRVWLSPELTLGQIDDLSRVSPVPLGLVVAGFQELMITEHCLLMSQGPCSETCETCPRRAVRHVLRDRKGFEFPVVTDALGRSHLYNGVELDLSAAIPDLIDIGVDALMVDTTLMSKQQAQAAVARIVRARDAAATGQPAPQKRPGTTTGHLFRGVM